MNLSIPIYIEEHKVAGSAQVRFDLRPLFFSAPVESGAQLSSVMWKLARKIRENLDEMATSHQQGGLVPWTFSPALAEHSLKFSVTLRRQTVDCRCLVLVFEALDRRLAVVPAVDDLWFEIARGQTVEGRAKEVIAAHLREREKESLEVGDEAMKVGTYSRAWVTQLELDVHPHPQKPSNAMEGLLSLFSEGPVSGRAELQKVGRCLDWLYPDDLDRVVLRDGQVEELQRLLAEPDKRPVMLIGPRSVGKTAILQEVVWRRVNERKTPHVSEKNVWLISPARLISGMSYVGQWENRLLAILKEAKERQHVLYFDDVLGLYGAGVSADSDLNVAGVMRPWIERREFRMLAEMTPEAFRVFQEKDRGLADQFHLVQVAETTEPQSRRVLIHVGREIEAKQRCRFDVEVLPAVMDLQMRHVRDQAMPGKAAGLLARLGLKFQGREVTRDATIGEFQASSGLSISFLDQTKRLERKGVIAALAKQIVGQEAALEALADVITIAKARLNDQGRPLGTLLFLGPTGVGKTQCAKAAAAYLYGDEARLLRFDMNEYVEADSAARLAGTFAQPEGLLTSAVRRQPYCVILLDEIEKAHGAVFDLLLQVLGEGRLTDALGRTSDFTSSMIIMTSNLGTRAAWATFGLKADDSAKKHDAFVDAAKRFFRPEFFNRIDRIVPFSELSKGHVEAIARQLIDRLFKREGLIHRRVALHIEPAALARIVEAGYHPQLGARALRRAIERQLTQPIAEKLAGMKPDSPTIVTVAAGQGGGVVPTIQGLIAVESGAQAGSALAACSEDHELVLERVEDYLDRLEERLKDEEAARPGASVSRDSMSAGHFKYFAIREQIGKVDRMIVSIDQETQKSAKSAGRGAMRSTARVPRPARRVRCVAGEDSGLLAGLLAAGDSGVKLGAMLERAMAAAEGMGDRVVDLLQEIALLEAMAGEGADRVSVEITCMAGERHAMVGWLKDQYLHLMARQHGFTAVEVKGDGAVERLVLEMPGIGRLLAGENGTHVFFPPGENFVPVDVQVVSLREGEETRRGTADQRMNAGAVVRLYDAAVATVDLRGGMICEGLPSAEELRRMVLAGVEMPAEVVGR